MTFTLHKNYTADITLSHEGRTLTMTIINIPPTTDDDTIREGVGILFKSMGINWVPDFDIIRESEGDVVQPNNGGIQ